MCSITYIKPMLSNFERLTPSLAPMGKVKVLDPSNFGEVPVLPAFLNGGFFQAALVTLEDGSKKLT